MRVSSTAILAVGRAAILPAHQHAGDHARLGVLSVTDHHSRTRILLNQEKGNNEMEPIFLRSCFPNSNFPARFPECPLQLMTRLWRLAGKMAVLR